MRARTTAILRSEQRLEDHYVLAGLFIIACILAFACVGDGKLGRFIAVAVEGVTIIVILRASQARPRTQKVVGVLVALALAAVALSSTSSGKISHAAPIVLGAFLALGAPITIVRRLRDQPEISFMTVAGALCIYLLAGLFFTLLYGSINALSDTPFFVQKTTANSVDFVYFSFVTMTTVGYGDLTARQDLGRMCAILEALFGQLYLVSVVALLVANIGRSRRHPPGVTPDEPAADQYVDDERG